MASTKRRRRRVDLPSLLSFSALLTGSAMLVCLSIFAHVSPVARTAIATIALALAEMARQLLTGRQGKRR